MTETKVTIGNNVYTGDAITARWNRTTTSDGKTLINTDVTVDVTVSKAWADGDNVSKHPAEIVYTLSNDKDSTTQTATGKKSNNNNYAASFTGLRKYDDTGALITYTVTEGSVPNYTLVATSSNNYVWVFTNKLGEGIASLQASKSMAHNTTIGTYSFTLTAQNGAPMPEAAGTATSLTVNNSGANVNFGTITFSKDNMANGTGGYEATKTFRYTIEEVHTGATASNNYVVNGVKYDPQTYTAEITVTYNATSGALAVGTPVYKDASGNTVTAAAFENDVVGSLKITKVVKTNKTGVSVDDLADGTYTFKVYTNEACTTEATHADGTDIETLQLTVSHGTVAAPLEVENMLAGTYYVKELAPEDSDTTANRAVTLDTAAHAVTVTAGKTGDDVDTTTGLATVTNEYELTEIGGTKTWYDESGKTHNNATLLTLVLERTTAATPGDDDWEAVTVTDSTKEHLAWTGDNYQYTNLAKKSPTGATYTYRVRETAVTGDYVINQDTNNFVNTAYTSASKTKAFANGWPANTKVEFTLSAKVGTSEYDLTGKTDAEGTTLQLTWNVTESSPTATWEKLRKYDENGALITYEITETKVTIGEGSNKKEYAGSAITERWNQNDANGVLTNTNVTMSVEGGKTWHDSKTTHDNATLLTLTLKRTPKPVSDSSVWETVTVASPITFAWTENTYKYDKLPKYNAEGVEYEYKVEEAPINGYLSEQDGNNFVNTELTQVEMTKQFGDGTKWPEGAVVEFTLSAKVDGATYDLTGAKDADGNDVPLTREATSNSRKVEWTKLRKYTAAGKEIVYSVTETKVTIGTNEPYTNSAITDRWEQSLSADGKTLINTGKTTERHAKKEWAGDGAEQSCRPESITYTLSAKDSSGATVTVANAEKTVQKTVTDYKADWTELPMYTDEGKLITYDVEETAVTGYTQTGKVFDEEKNTWTFTNTRDKGTIEVTKKIYLDGVETTDTTLAGKEFKVTIKNKDSGYLQRDKSFSATSAYEWTVKKNAKLTVSDVPTGTYTITETSTGRSIELYAFDNASTTVFTDQNLAKGATLSVEMVNKYTREKGSLKFQKTVTVNGQTIPDTTQVDGIYTFHIESVDDTEPETDARVKLTITKGKVSVVETSLTHTEDLNTGIVTIKDLPTGEYKITEELTPAQIASGIRFTNPTTGYFFYTVDPEGTENIPTALFTNDRILGSLKLKKIVTVNGETTTGTIADGQYIFNLREHGKTTNLRVITIKIQNGKMVSTGSSGGSLENGWYVVKDLPLGSYDIIELTNSTNLPEGVHLISAEPTTDNQIENGTTVTIALDDQNEVVVPTATFTNNRIYVQVQKRDFNTKEPLSGALFKVYKGTDTTGTPIDTWTSDKDEPHVVTGLEPDATYTLHEEEAPNGYTVTTDKVFTIAADGTVTVSDTRANYTGTEPLYVENEKTTIKVKKTDIATGNELPGAKIQILDADGNVVKIDGVPCEWVSDDSPEGHVISGLPTGVTFTLHEEVAPTGYTIAADTTFTIAADGTVTSSGTITTDGIMLIEDETEITSVCIYKVWDDDGNRDGIRPLSLEVTLYGDGEKVCTVTMGTVNDWYARVDDLPMMKDGKEIEYTWKESSVSGYTLSNTVKSGNLTILTNKHGPVPTKVEVTKRWNDGGAKERPAEIQVQLFADGIAVDKPVTLNAGNNWHTVWDNIPKCTNPDGRTGTQKDIRYTVEEVNVPAGYECRISGSQEAGYVITNTRDSGKLVIDKKFDILPKEEIPPEEIVWIYLPVTKTWEDHDNRDGNRPQSITVHLWKGGEEAGTAVLSEGTGWSYTFGPLPKFAGENEIVYTITEDPVKYYTTKIEGFHITNTYQEELTSVSVRKVWDDNNNEAGKRPTSIHMTLSNGAVVILNEANNWQATVKDLPVRVNGKVMVYTWREQEVIGYQQTSVVQTGNMTVFTNSLYERPPLPEDAGNPPLPGDTWYLFEEYETPLGVEVIINHVGDCFD